MHAQAEAPRAYSVQAQPFKKPSRISRRGLRHTITPPKPLPLKRKSRILLADEGYAVTTHWQKPLIEDTLPWDGNINGITLNDGKYTLRLKAGAEEKTVEVVIDRTAPTFDFFIDNQLVRGANGKLIGSVTPEFRLSLKDTLAGFANKNDVELTMPRRRDGVTPTVSQDTVEFQSETTNASYKYSTPLRQQQLLLPGDQWVDIKVRDAAGNEVKRRVSFAVGARNLYSGGGSTGAYQLMQAAGTETREYRLPAKFNGYTVERIPAEVFAPSDPELPQRPNYYVYLLRASAVAGPVTIVFFDDEISDAIQFFKTRSRKFKTEFGDIILPDSIIKHASNKHHEVSPTKMADAVSCLVESTRRGGQFEFWNDPTPTAGISESHLLIVKFGSTIYKMPIERLSPPQPGSEFLSVKTMFGYRHKPRGVGPLPNIRDQWSGAAIDVARFKRKEFPKAPWQLDNPNPEYPKHLAGEIDDDQIKPYKVIFEVRADADPTRAILKKQK